jgi:hypothetical protein
MVAFLFMNLAGCYDHHCHLRSVLSDPLCSLYHLPGHNATKKTHDFKSVQAFCNSAPGTVT